MGQDEGVQSRAEGIFKQQKSFLLPKGANSWSNNYIYVKEYI